MADFFVGSDPVYRIDRGVSFGKPNSQEPLTSPLPEGEGTDRSGWSSYADVRYRVELIF